MTSYSTVQKQQLSQLGAYLQEKRQEQGKSLEDISLQTYIRAQLLKAVENGDPSDLPQPIFVQGFIRRYADALGLDGTNFSKQFPVHSIPNTPRPVPRPAAQVDMSYQTLNQKPPVQINQPQIDQPEPAVGALPVRQPTPVESVGAPEKTVTEQPLPAEVATAKTDTNSSKEFTLDPKPMSDSELAALGLNGLGDGVGTPSPKTYQSLPFAKETKPETPTKPETKLADDPPLSSLPADDQAAPVGAMPVEPATPIRASLSNEPASTFNWLPWGIGAAVLVGAIALIGPRIIGGDSGQQTEQATPPQTEEVTQPEPTVVEAAPEPEPEPELPVGSAPVNLQVEITEAGPSWMSIVIDGELVFEGLMDPGTVETWEGEQSITMNVGNAGAALISANGSEPVPAGNPGGAEFLTFTAEGE